MHVKVAFGQATIRPPHMASLPVRTGSGAAHAVHRLSCMFLFRMRAAQTAPSSYRAT